MRESYRRTLAGFLGFYQRRQARATVARAREHVNLQRLERTPGPAQLGEWKDALNWFFCRGKGAAGAALPGVPALGRADLGQSDCERRPIVA